MANNWLSIAKMSGTKADSVQTTTVTAAENQSSKSRKGTIEIRSKQNPAVKQIISVEQAAGTFSFSDIEVVSFKYNNISADASAPVFPTVHLRQTVGWNGATTGITTFEYKASNGTDGAVTGGTSSAESPATIAPVITFSGNGVDAPTGKVSGTSKGTTVSSESTVATAQMTITWNGKTKTVSAVVKQDANVATYGEVTINGSDPDDVYANGTNIPTAATNVSATQAVSYTSGAKSTLTLSVPTPKITWGTYNESGAWVDGSRPVDLGSTQTERTQVGEMDYDFVCGDGVTKTKVFDIYQEANTLLYKEYDQPTGTIYACLDGADTGVTPDEQLNDPGSYGLVVVGDSYTLDSRGDEMFGFACETVYQNIYTVYTSHMRNGAPATAGGSSGLDKRPKFTKRFVPTLTFEGTSGVSWFSHDTSVEDNYDYVIYAKWDPNGTESEKTGPKLRVYAACDGSKAFDKLIPLNLGATNIKITVTPMSINATANGGATTINITSNDDWIASVN